MRIDELRSDSHLEKTTRHSTRLDEPENGKSNHGQIDVTTARISVSSNDSSTENVEDNSANNQPTIVLLP